MRLDETGDLFDPDDEDNEASGQPSPGTWWSGIDLLDGEADGLQPTDLLLVVGPPGVGVTSLLMTFARHLAVRNAARTLFASASAPAERIAPRLLAGESGVLPPDAATGPLDARSRRRRRTGRERLSHAPLTIVTEVTDRGDLLDLTESVRFDVAVIDDLSAFDSMPSRSAELMGPLLGIPQPPHILRALKAAALRNGLAVIAGMSAPAHAAVDRIELSDLSLADLVDPADVVLTLRRDTDEPDLIEARIAKNRYGLTNVTDRLALLADRGIVANLARRKTGDAA